MKCFLEEWGQRAGRTADLGRKPLHTLVVGFEVGAADQVDAVGHGGEDAVDLLRAIGIFQAFQRFGDGFGLAGQVDDQALVADHGHLARQDGGGHKGQADLAHLLAEARHFLVGHGQGGLGRDIAQGRAGAAGGEHQRAACVHQLDQRVADAGLFVGDEAGVEGDRVLQRAGQPVLQRGQAFVFVDAGAGAVADGHDADAHRFRGRGVGCGRGSWAYSSEHCRLCRPGWCRRGSGWRAPAGTASR